MVFFFAPFSFYTPSSKDSQSTVASEPVKAVSAETGGIGARFATTAEVTVSKIFP